MHFNHLLSLFMTVVWSHHFFVVTYVHEKKKGDIKNYGSASYSYA